MNLIHILNDVCRFFNSVKYLSITLNMYRVQNRAVNELS